MGRRAHSRRAPGARDPRQQATVHGYMTASKPPSDGQRWATSRPGRLACQVGGGSPPGANGRRESDVRATRSERDSVLEGPLMWVLLLQHASCSPKETSRCALPHSFVRLSRSSP
jgi:hypothetical protein